MPTQAIGWGVETPEEELHPIHFERRDLRDHDVAIRITYSGICHSDLHQCRNDWHNSQYPVVPGHEIVGEVTAVGPAVTDFAVGDTVAVGTVVDSCLECSECQAGWEQFCLKGSTFTYNGKDKQDGTITKGGYSDHIVTRDHFVFKLPDGLDPSKAAPLLCAGITTFSPLNQHGIGADHKVAVVGLGGLGHMGVKFAVAMGAHVTVISTSPEKAADAQRLGAHDVLISKDAAAMAGAMGRFDFILDTVPVAHDLNPYLMLLKRGGKMVLVGAIEPLPPVHGGALIMGNKALGGSGVGGVPETVQMLDFCAAHSVLPDVEMIAMKDVNTAFDRMEKGDVRYRFVIDMAHGL